MFVSSEDGREYELPPPNATGVPMTAERLVLHGSFTSSSSYKPMLFLALSGLSQRDFAARLGTSASRLSTYLNGKVTPGADLLIRAERIGEDESGDLPRPVRAASKVARARG